MLHFGRRGRENLSNLTRQHFAVQRDADGKFYVYQGIDEKTKNHQSDSEVSVDSQVSVDSELSVDGRMYEIKGTYLIK